MRFREPLLLPALAFAVGIGLSRLLALDPPVAFLGALVVAGLSWKRFQPGLLVAVLIAGAASGSIPVAPAPALSVPDNTPAIFSGCVVEPAMSTVDRERFVVELASHARARVTLLARNSQPFPALSYGTRVEFEGRVRKPRNFADPGAFDNVSFLARQYVYWTATADVSSIRILPGRCGGAAMSVIFAIRTAALTRIEQLFTGNLYATGMMQAVLIGETSKLDRLWTEDFRSTGTFHALVISGSHVAVIAAILLLFMRIIGLPANLALLLTLLAAWLYAGVTGWQSPVLRSAAGMTLFVIARLVYRRQSILNTLSAVALVFLIADPGQLFDASFQLSFLAVAVIGAFVIPIIHVSSGPLAAGLSDLHDDKKDIRLPAVTAQFRIELRLLAATLKLIFRVPVRFAMPLIAVVARVLIYLYEILIASLLIQIGLALPMAIYFHRLSASGLTANAIIIPILTLLVPLGFAAILVNSHVLASVCASLLSLARFTAHLHAGWEPDWRIPPPPVWLAIVFIALLLLAAIRAQNRWLRFATVLGIATALIAIVLHPFSPRVEAGKLELSVLDVGQGDSLLVGFPSGKLMLIDAGGIPSFGRPHKAGIDIGEDVVSPYLWSRSIRHLDIVAMTHAHEDHMGGMAAVLRNFHPGELWTGAVPDSAEWRRIKATADELHIRVRPQLRGEPFAFGGTSVKVLSPGRDYQPAAIPKNNDSLALRIVFGKTSFLLTGDMEKQIESELATLGLLQHDDVIKVGHHGSRTSTTAEFLDLEKPVFGLISAGFENSYGHPHPQVLAALDRHHVNVLRTDRDGLVTVISDGRHIRVEKTLP